MVGMTNDAERLFRYGIVQHLSWSAPWTWEQMRQLLLHMVETYVGPENTPVEITVFRSFTDVEFNTFSIRVDELP